MGSILELGGAFGTLLAAIEAAGASDFLDEEGPITLFAPIDNAFEALPDGVLDVLLEPSNQGLLIDLLAAHTLDTGVLSSQLSSGELETLGGNVPVDVSSSGVRVGNANVLRADVQGSNGVIHVIDQVIVPDSVAERLESLLSESTAEQSSATTGSTETAPARSEEVAPAPVSRSPQPPEPETAPSNPPATPVRGLW